MQDEGSQCVPIKPPNYFEDVLKQKNSTNPTTSEHLAENQMLLEQIVNNYVIVKNILRCLSWRDQLLCKFVCRMWRDAVLTLQLEILSARNFVLSLSPGTSVLLYQESQQLCTEPLIIFTFINDTAFHNKYLCNLIYPNPCEPACNETHSGLDVIYQKVCYPKQCMIAIKSDYLTYMPTPKSTTAKYILRKNTFRSKKPYFAGLFIPKMPYVKSNIINLCDHNNFIQEFNDRITKISENELIKGVIVFLTDKFLLETIIHRNFLEYIKQIQPDIPFALGGCFIDDTLTNFNNLAPLMDHLNDVSSFYGENIATICVFTVPKKSEEYSNFNFEMYSLVIEIGTKSKNDIQTCIKKFAESIPRFEHSAALKLSCVGRDRFHDKEQESFRDFFPDTPLIGCYGNGEIGLNHPPKQPVGLNIAKRIRTEPSEDDNMYTYSTILVYFGWGKKLAESHI